MASAGEPKTREAPFTTTSPDIGRSIPKAMRIKVVLPAPFSPSTA